MALHYPNSIGIGEVSLRSQVVPNSFAFYFLLLVNNCPLSFILQHTLEPGGEYYSLVPSRPPYAIVRILVELTHLSSWDFLVYL